MKLYMNAAEVAEAVGVSKPTAYKIIKALNEELTNKGYITVSGKVSEKYFRERYYGAETVTIG